MKIERLRSYVSCLPLRYALPAAIIVTVMFATALAGDIEQVDTESSRQLAKQAEKLIRKGNLIEAEKLLRRAVEAGPDNNDAKLRLAFVCIKQRHLMRRIRSASRSLRKYPKNSYAFAIWARRFSEREVHGSARMFYNSLSLNKREALAWAGFGMLEFYENRVDDSINHLRAAVYHDPDQPDYYFSLAQVSARSERYKEAADAYYRFLALSRDTDDERRARIKGLINFLNFLGQRQSLYTTLGEGKTSVPFKLAGNRPVIQLKVNGHDDPLNFVLDTGSGISVISDETAKMLKIDPITKGGFAKGIGGDGKFEIIYGFLAGKYRPSRDP